MTLPSLDDLAPSTETQAPLARRKVLLILLGVLLVCNSPIMLAGFLIKHHPSVAVTLDLLGMLLCVALPFLAARRWPRAAGFDHRWLPLRKRDYLLFVPLIVIAFAWATFGFWALITLGWWSKDPWPFGTAGPITAFVSLLSVVVVGPIAEEVLYRGYVQDQLRKVTGGYIAIVLQAVLFALYHVPYRGILSLMVFVLALLFGFWRHWKRCLVPLILVHMLLNGLPAVSSYLTVRKMNRAAAEAEASPKGQAMAAWAEKAPEVGIPEIVPYLSSPN